MGEEGCSSILQSPSFSYAHHFDFKKREVILKVVSFIIFLLTNLTLNVLHHTIDRRQISLCREKRVHRFKRTQIDGKT